MKHWILTFSILILAASCGHKHEVSEDLKKAHAIQKEALAISKSIDDQLKKGTIANASDIKNMKSRWLKNMVVIEGVEHDHSNCNGDHRKAEYGVTDKEMITVQTTWKDSILIIQNKIVNVE